MQARRNMVGWVDREVLCLTSVYCQVYCSIQIDLVLIRTEYSGLEGIADTEKALLLLQHTKHHAIWLLFHHLQKSTNCPDD